jgi:hypothetical protein
VTFAGDVSFSPPALSEIFEEVGGCCSVDGATAERFEYQNWINST